VVIDASLSSDTFFKWLSSRRVTLRSAGSETLSPYFTGVGIPYNEKLISLDEIGLIGKKLYEIDLKIQVCALDYRPEFERLDLQRPSYGEMVKVHDVLKDAGLKTVICQTDRGHIGP